MISTPLTYFAKTDRLIIRPYQIADVPDFLDMVQSSMDQMHAFLPWVTPDFDERNAISFVHSAIFALKEKMQYDYAIILRKEKRLIGGVGLINPDPIKQQTHVGYFMRSDKTGKGLMTEAVKAAIESAHKKLSFNTFLIDCDEKNVASLRVIEKLNAQYLGREENAETMHGELIHKKFFKICLEP
jgi:ribosomal-protein-serine acetyltransferase